LRAAWNPLIQIFKTGFPLAWLPDRDHDRLGSFIAPMTVMSQSRFLILGHLHGHGSARFGPRSIKHVPLVSPASTRSLVVASSRVLKMEHTYLPKNHQNLVLAFGTAADLLPGFASRRRRGWMFADCGWKNCCAEPRALENSSGTDSRTGSSPKGSRGSWSRVLTTRASSRIILLDRVM